MAFVNSGQFRNGREVCKRDIQWKSMAWSQTGTIASWAEASEHGLPVLTTAPRNAPVMGTFLLVTAIQTGRVKQTGWAPTQCSVTQLQCCQKALITAFWRGVSLRFQWTLFTRKLHCSCLESKFPVPSSCSVTGYPFHSTASLSSSSVVLMRAADKYT